NTATATPSNGSPASGSGTETVLAPSLSVTKTPDAATVNSTDTVSFTNTVSEAAAAGSAYGVVLNDPLPTPTGVSWTSATLVSGSAPAPTLSGNTLSDNIGTLAAGSSVVFHVSGTPAPYTTLFRSNTATATPTNGSSASGSGTETVRAPSLSVTKTPDAATVN